MNQKILIGLIILCFLIIWILSFSYFGLVNKNKIQESKIQELKTKITEFEKQKTNQIAKNEEIQKITEELKKEEIEEKKEVKAGQLEINRQFTILGYEEGTLIQKKIMMTIESVEKREELPAGASPALRERASHDPANEVILIVKGKLTNSEKTKVEVDPTKWLRIFNAGIEELYSPKTEWAAPVLPPESTLEGLTRGAIYGEEIGIVFIVPRDASLFLRVTDAFGRGIPIELNF